MATYIPYGVKHPTGRMPASKVVGNLAIHLVAKGVSPDDFADNPNKYDIPESVVGFLAGELGTPPGGWPEPFRTKVLEHRNTKIYEPVPLSMELERDLTGPNPISALNKILFPESTKEFEEAVEHYGPLSVMSSSPFFCGLEPGDETIVTLSLRGKTIFGT